MDCKQFFGSLKKCPRKTVKEARRLARIVQATMSLEGQGMEKRRFHEIKKQIIKRLIES